MKNRCNILLALLFTAAAAFGGAKHVVLIGVDGCGARYIDWNKMPNLKALADDGLCTTARCHRITASAINWKSVFSGQPPEIHGFSKWNSKFPEIEPAPAALDSTGSMPCIFSEIRRQMPDAYTACFFTWDGIGFAMNTNAINTAKLFTTGFDAYPGLEAYPAKDAVALDKAIEELASSPTLMLVYQGQVDSFGHKYGWGSPEFYAACANVDENIGRFMAALKASPMWNDTAVLMVADHGGLEKRHGGAEDIRVFEVPFIVSGPAAKGLKPHEPAMLEDVSPTIASLLGLEIPSAWRGRPAFVNIEN